MSLWAWDGGRVGISGSGGGGGGGSPALTKQTFTSGTTALNGTTDIADCDCSSGPITITLPAASAKARLVILQDNDGNAGTNNVTLDPAGTDTINGLNANHVISTAWFQLTLVSDGVGAWRL